MPGLRSHIKFEEAGDLSVRAMLPDATHHKHVQMNPRPILNGLTHPGYALSACLKLLSLYRVAYSGLEVSVSFIGVLDVVEEATPRGRVISGRQADFHGLGIDTDS